MGCYEFSKFIFVTNELANVTNSVLRRVQREKKHNLKAVRSNHGTEDEKTVLTYFKNESISAQDLAQHTPSKTCT